MMTRRTTFLAAASTLITRSAAATGKSVPSDARDVADVIALSARANSALMRGDIATYTSLIAYSDDFTFMSPFGGQTRRRKDLTDERIQAMGRTFRNGVFDQEVVEAYAAGDLVVLVLIERQTVEVGGLPAQDWPLRVTLVWRAIGGGWQLVHRHADPLVHEIGLNVAAALARGDSCTRAS
jgi:ketosteroid isomerase-like protein